MKKNLTFHELASEYDVVSCDPRKVFIDGQACNGYLCRIANRLTRAEKVKLSEYSNVKIYDGYLEYSPEQRFTYVLLIASRSKK